MATYVARIKTNADSKMCTRVTFTNQIELHRNNCALPLNNGLGTKASVFRSDFVKLPLKYRFSNCIYQRVVKRNDRIIQRCAILTLRTMYFLRMTYFQHRSPVQRLSIASFNYRCSYEIIWRSAKDRFTMIRNEKHDCGHKTLVSAPKTVSRFNVSLANGLGKPSSFSDVLHLYAFLFFARSVMYWSGVCVCLK